MRLRIERKDNQLWYLQRRTWYGLWLDVENDEGSKICDAAFGGGNDKNGIFRKVSNWMLENCCSLKITKENARGFKPKGDQRDRS